MKFDHFTPIPKSKLDRVKELYHALSIISDSLDLLKKGHYYQIQVLYAQLRALLTDKATKPLFFEVEEILNHKLNIYFSSSENCPEISGLVLKVDSLPISANQILPNQKQILLKEFLDENTIHYKSRDFKVREIINVLANEYGGAHYSKKTPKYLYELLKFGMNGQPIVDNLIFQFAEVAFQCGIELIKKIVDFEIYFHLYLPKHKTGDEKVLFDFCSQEFGTRLLLIYHQGTYKFMLVDVFGQKHPIPFNQTIKPNELYLINISHEISTDYKSTFKIHANESLIVNKTLDFPILFINEFQNSDLLINRSKEIEKQDFEFGFNNIAAYGNIINHIDKINMFNFFSNEENDTTLWINANTTGERKAGANKINWSKGTEIKKINEI